MGFLSFPVRQVLAGAAIIMILPACKPKTKALKSPPHYNFSAGTAPKKLEDRLLEISGIAWDSKNNVFYAVHDESDKLYVLDRYDNMIKEEIQLEKKDDYEDVALYKGTPFILRSDGAIFKVLKDNTGKTIALEVGELGLEGTNDFEAMYADTVRGALITICKNCEMDNDNTVSAFAFYPDSTGYDKKPVYVIDAKKIDEISPVGSSKFQPSAAAIHPKTNKLYILSSASNQMAIADLDGKVESVFRLSPKMFPQAEGVTFQSTGDMFISNEGLAKKRKATMQRFAYIETTDSAKKQVVKSGYNFTEPAEKMQLGKHLNEISGMAYVPGKEVILAENDEKGDIFILDFKNKLDKMGKIRFGGKGDYEDIVYTDTAVYMLVSPGSVVKVRTSDSSFVTEQFDLGKTGTNEFEAMYMDADGKSLILLCKDCAKEKNQVRVAYRFNLATQKFDDDPAYTINISEIQAMLGDGKAEFKPSAAGINPVNGKLYIVASVGKVLVMADIKGKIEAVFPLDPVMYNQPEGLTFAPNGDLYISNEGGEGVATILKLLYKK